ncbi:glycosyltransferase family 2 protein [Faunimonas sp. B44]|uniref:glycosyltransferase family 2 protein n=1 Tax=Faunimonas sp. B44 TaxID=3461493 RepID=UPI004044E45A
MAISFKKIVRRLGSRLAAEPRRRSEARKEGQEEGQYEGNRAEAARLIAESGLFDEAFYRESYAIGHEADAISDYLAEGWSAGRKPNPLFDPAYYLSLNRDVLESGMEPLTHFILYGARERRSASPAFLTRYYVERNPEVLATGMNPLRHYLERGRAEGLPARVTAGERAGYLASKAPRLPTRPDRLFSRYPTLNGIFLLLDGANDDRLAEGLLRAIAPFRIPVVPVTAGGRDAGRPLPGGPEMLDFDAFLADAGGDAGRAWNELAGALQARAISVGLALSLPAARYLPPLRRRGLRVAALGPGASGAEAEAELDGALSASFFADLVVSTGAPPDWAGGLPEERVVTLAGDPRTPDAAFVRELLAALEAGAAGLRRIRGEGRARRGDVSVGLPAYNAERDIEERVWSIFEQSVLPAEIIAFDDASKDRTLDCLYRLSALSPVPMRIEGSERNSGSPYVQWRKCLEAARGEWCWIAESDDVAHPAFLEEIGRLAGTDESCAIAYARSTAADAHSRIHSRDQDEYLKRIAPGRDWDQPFRAEGRAEIRACLYLGNIIPNVSAALLRRRAALACIEAAADFPRLGDWALYAAMLERGSLAYSPRRLNLHRRHGEGVIAGAQRQAVFHVERAALQVRIAEAGLLEPAQVEAIAALQLEEFHVLLGLEDAADDSFLRVFHAWLRDIAGGRVGTRTNALALVSVDGACGALRDLQRAHRLWVAPAGAFAGELGCPEGVGVLPELSPEELARFCRLARIERIAPFGAAAERLAETLGPSAPPS